MLTVEWGLNVLVVFNVDRDILYVVKFLKSNHSEYSESVSVLLEFALEETPEVLHPYEETCPDDKDLSTLSVPGQTWSVDDEEVHDTNVVDVDRLHAVDEDEGEDNDVNSFEDVEEELPEEVGPVVSELCKDGDFDFISLNL